jgi:hypothetical protein
MNLTLSRNWGEPVINRRDRRPDRRRLSVEVLGKGQLSELMVKELLRQGVAVDHYISQGAVTSQFEKGSGVSVTTLSSTRGLVDKIKNFGSGYSLVFNFDKVPKNVIDQCGGQMLGLHPSKLPGAYAGCNDPVGAMREDGVHNEYVTLFQLDRNLDNGSVIGWSGFDLRVNESGLKSKSEVRDRIYIEKVVPAGAQLFADYLANREVLGDPVSQKDILTGSVFVSGPRYS